MTAYEKISDNVLKNVCNIIGATDSCLSWSKLLGYLNQVNIENVHSNGEMINKRTKLFDALSNAQLKYKCSNNIIDFIQRIMDPSNYTQDTELFAKRQTELNAILSFDGLSIGDDGKFRSVIKASKISDIKIKVDNLKEELIERNAHAQIFNYCKEELIQNNYFHAVFEANKGLFNRIRELSGLSKDGNTLIEEVFSKTPILIINKFQSQSEMDEHTGFANLLKGLCGMFRNPSAHEPKVYWPITEQDALEILGIISYAHRRLDNAQKIR